MKTTDVNTWSSLLQLRLRTFECRDNKVAVIQQYQCQWIASIDSVITDDISTLRGDMFIFAGILVATLTVHAPLASSAQWKDFKLSHGKEYRSHAEESARLAVWEKHRQYVENHNVELAKGRHTYSLSLNRHADLDHEEHKILRFRGSGIRGKPSNMNKPSGEPLWREISAGHIANLPARVDWREKGYVTDVMDQGACSSSYAFAGLGVIESLLYNKTGKKVKLSAQNIVDCSHMAGTDGCDGGFLDHTLDYDMMMQGVNTEEDYPFTGTEGPCRFRSSTKVAYLGSYIILPGLNETILQAALATVGPVAVNIDASSRGFRFYQAGVLVDNACERDWDSLLHAVLIVGYGTSKYGQDYWIVRNSWGKHWGMDGYVLMARNHGNMCGISTHPVYAADLV